MYWLVGQMIVETVCEGLLCAGVAATFSGLRKLLCVLAAVALTSLTLAATIHDWQVWVWVIPIVIYRLINLYRIYTSRLPAPQLRTVSTRAFGWLIAAEAAVVLIAWAVTRYGHVMTFFDVLIVAQLFSAIILLRASTHTWQHAALVGEPERMSDRELPALSVLIPARNETDDLDRCLQLMIASDYPKLEIVVLDDCSVNRRTPEIIRSFAHDGVRFIQGQLPDETRWLAKNFAYEQLAQEASGDLLLFCGVDARVEPHTLRDLVCLLYSRKKDMLSVMPQREASATQGNSLLQAMRYYWEICLPRRFFKRPPVLSTCWLIKREALDHMGGFESVRRSVNPEAPLARKAVVTDAYSFIRSDERLGVRSDKSEIDQYATSIRVRYPQLHRRLELVALVSVYELVFLIGPFIGLLLVGSLQHATAYIALWSVTVFFLLTTYGIVVLGAKLSDPWYGWALMPVSVLVDLVVLNVSLWKYEFSTVEWKGRNVCVPVMQVEPHLPKLP
jgi:glycosyltransferase involved in cell wall biosynthesis